MSQAQAGVFPHRVAGWCLFTMLALGGAVPWYTLRAFPLLTIDAGAVNVLDVLVGGAVFASAPAIAGALRRGEYVIWTVFLFAAYMIVPFALGLLHDHDAWFYAVRETRALAFYALAAAFAAGRYTTRDYRRFAGAYAIGALIGIGAAAIHVLWRAPLPGYPAMIGYTPSSQAGVLVRYLDWSVPVVAFLFCLAGVLNARPAGIRALWAVGLCCTVWYLIAMHERTAQAAASAAGIALMLAPSLGGLTRRRLVIAAAVVLLIGGFGLGLIPGPQWIRQPAVRMVGDWSQLGTGDGSVRVRITELRNAVPRFRSHPLLGGGLGSIVEERPPDFPGGPWRYISSGFGYLLVKTGVVGLLLYLGMAGVAMHRGWNTVRGGREAGNWPQWSIGMVGMAALFVLNVAHPVVDVPEGAIAFSLFFGMLTGASGLGAERSPASLNEP